MPFPPDIQSNPYISNYLLRLKIAMSSNGMRSTPRSAIAVEYSARADGTSSASTPLEERAEVVHQERELWQRHYWNMWYPQGRN